MSLFNYFKRQSTAERCTEEREIPAIREPMAGTSCSEPSTSASAEKRSASPTSATTAKAKKSKHAVGFNAEWRKGRPWLQYTEGIGMFCSFCQLYDKRPFDRDTWNKTTCKRLRLESINDHAKCQAHLDSLKLTAAESQHENITEAIIPSVSLNDMSKTFACLYFLWKPRMAHTTNFEPLLDFIGFLGDNIRGNIYQGRNAHYTSRKSIQEMLKCMSDIIEEDILADLRKSEHFSLMFDETTDCSVREQMTLRGRYIDGEGDIKVKFLKLHECLTDRVTLDAETISGIVIDYISQSELLYTTEKNRDGWSGCHDRSP